MMNRPMISMGALLLASAALAAAQEAPRQSSLSATAPQLLVAGTPAPDFPNILPDGGAVSISDYKGKVVLLDFWATWCHPCLKGLPRTQAMAKQYREQGVTVLAVNTFDEPARFEAWLEQNRAQYPDLVFLRDTSRSGRTGMMKGNGYGVSKLPTQFVVGRDGTVVGSVVGLGSSDEHIEALLGRAGVKVQPIAAAPGAGGGGSAMPMVTMMLELSEEQKAQVEPLLAKFVEERTRITADASLGDDVKSGKIDEAFARTKEALQPFLTQQQRAKLEQMKFKFGPRPSARK